MDSRRFHGGKGSKLVVASADSSRMRQRHSALIMRSIIRAAWPSTD
jgi:hypothetical protein